MASIEKTEHVISVILMQFVMNSTSYSNVTPLLIYGKLSYHPTAKIIRTISNYKNIMSDISCNISNELAKYLKAAFKYCNIYISELLKWFLKYRSTILTIFIYIPYYQLSSFSSFFHVYYTVTHTFTFYHVTVSCLKHGSAAICAVLMSRTRCCHGKIKLVLLYYIILYYITKYFMLFLY